jgi:hypothetical protein
MIESSRASSCLNFKGKPLPSKKKGFLNYTDQEWEDLAVAKNFMDAIISNIQGEVMTLKDGPDWISSCLYNLNPSNAENAPVPNAYIQAVQKFAKCIVDTATRMEAVMYDVRVSKTLQREFESSFCIFQGTKREAKDLLHIWF